MNFYFSNLLLTSNLIQSINRFLSCNWIIYFLVIICGSWTTSISANEDKDLLEAITYLQSEELKQRVKAQPIFEKMAKQGNIDAMYYLAASELTGTLGYLKRNYIYLYEKELKEHHEEDWEIITRAHEELENLVSNRFEEILVWYSAARDVCEQVIATAPKTLENPKEYLYVNHIRSCLTKHPSNKDPTKIMSLLGEYERIACGLAEPEDNHFCIFEGYELIASGEVDFNDNVKSKKLAFALSRIFDSHKLILSRKAKEDNKPTPRMSEKVFNFLGEAMNLMDKDKYREAIKVIKNGISKNQKNITSYEWYSIYNSLALCHFNLDETEAAIDYFRKVIETPGTPNKNRWQTEEYLGKLYFSNELYLPYIKHVAFLYEKYQGDKRLIPEITIANIKKLQIEKH